MKKRLFYKNLSYTFASNLVAMFVSITTVLIFPKYMGIAEYGYWQLYLLYTSYVSLFQFGWNDGIYLRYGGMYYEDLDKKLFFSQFYSLAIFQSSIAIIFLLIIRAIGADDNKNFIFIIFSIVMVIMNLRYMLLFVLQATNRIKEFAVITTIGKGIFVLVALLLFINHTYNYKYLVIGDMIGKLFSLIIAIYFCKEIVINNIKRFNLYFAEIVINISAGIKLLIANLASNLIIGVVRLGIEKTWSIVIFSKVSLTLSISNLVMVFINAVGIVIYPILRRLDSDRIAETYITMRGLLMIILFFAITLFYPLQQLLIYWLPQYSESIKYMSILFPMIIYEGKTALLTSTFLKTIRREDLILKTNIIALSLSLIMTFLSTKVFSNLDLTVTIILFLIISKSIMQEVLLSNIIKVKINIKIVTEISMTLFFIYFSHTIQSIMVFFIHAFLYMCYLIINREDINKSYLFIKKI